MSEAWEAIAADFGDLSTATAVQLAVRLVVAGLLGAVIGWNRGRAGKDAGLRTHVLVAVGAAGFIAFPTQAGFGSDALSRVIQGMLAGIGFLGAGCVVKAEGGHVRGLTTAAGIWATTAMGAAAGSGRLGTAALIGIASWVALVGLKSIERAGNGSEPTGSPHE